MTKIAPGFPVSNTHISHPFGEDTANDPIKKDYYKLFDKKHSGVDFSVAVGTPVFACLPGIVVRKEFHKGMGNVLGLRYANIVVLYAHLSKFEVKLGRIVKKKQKIGLSGNSGEATTEPHLHLEIRDITKPTLKEMVFDPPFGKPIKQLKESFVYVVNNVNTDKTLKFLSEKYFGSPKYWTRIWDSNMNLPKKVDFVLAEGTKVIIPNYR